MENEVVKAVLNSVSIVITPPAQDEETSETQEGED
jgi:hypothetical protein